MDGSERELVTTELFSEYGREENNLVFLGTETLSVSANRIGFVGPVTGPVSSLVIELIYIKIRLVIIISWPIGDWIAKQFSLLKRRKASSAIFSTGFQSTRRP